MSGASGTFCLWLDYALSVIQPMDHLTACRLATGGAPTPGLEADIRWPGYVGPAYESAPFRLLFVGQVHYPEELERTLGHFQNNMHTWANNPRTPRGDDQFLQLLQAEYRKAIPQWGPWKRPFSKLSNRQGLTLDQIAYANIAKCWLTVRPEDKPNTTKPMRACMVKFSLKDLAKRLGAQCAVVLCGKSFVLPDLNIPYVTLRMRCSDRAVDEAHEALKLVRSGRVTSGRIAIEG